MCVSPWLWQKPHKVCFSKMGVTVAVNTTIARRVRWPREWLRWGDQCFAGPGGARGGKCSSDVCLLVCCVHLCLFGWLSCSFLWVWLPLLKVIKWHQTSVLMLGALLNRCLYHLCLYLCLSVCCQFVCFYCMFEFECFFWLLGPIDTHSPVWKTTVGTGRRRRRRRSWMWSRRCSNGEKLSSPCECDMFSYYELMCSKVMCFIVLVFKTLAMFRVLI